MAAGNLIVDAKLFFISQKMTANTAVICNENSSLEKITWIKKDGKNTAGHFHFARVIVNTMTLPSTRRAVTPADSQSPCCTRWKKIGSFRCWQVTGQQIPTGVHSSRCTMVWGFSRQCVNGLPHRSLKHFPSLRLRGMNPLCLLMD